MKFLFWAKGMFDDYLEDATTVIIEASNFKKAFEKYKNNLIENDDCFLEGLYSFGINYGWTESLWLSNEEEQNIFMENNGQAISEAEFNKRLMAFLENNQEWYEMVINHAEENETYSIENPFPDEMIKLIWEKTQLPKFDDNFQYVNLANIKSIK